MSVQTNECTENQEIKVVIVEDYKLTRVGLRCALNQIENINVVAEAESAEEGIEIIKREQPDVVLVASGSEVSTLAAGAELLRKDGISTQIVSVPSEGLFRLQPKEYQEKVLPKNIKRFGLTAGLPITLEGLIGEHGTVWGMESFGFSAPYPVLDEKLGFTADNVYKQVKELLKK